jgi:diketogulonate reductase-like aldo/keto reductase
MEEIFNRGLARSIGVSNYSIRQLEEIRDYCEIPPSVNQIEFHPYNYVQKLMEYCQANQIVLEAYSPLARGFDLYNDKIGRIADAHQKTNAQVVLRWNIQHGNVVIPKSIHQERIEENFQIFDFELKKDEMETLDNLNEDYEI